MKYLKDHDCHVFFTASGASETDQICDCGVMAHVQGAFAEYLGDWKFANPGKEFLPYHWNLVFQQACDHLGREGSKAIISACRKTGWYPLNRNAENYEGLYDISTVVDPRGAARLRDSNKAAGYKELRAAKHEQATMTEFKARKPDGGTERFFMREKVVEWFTQSTVMPAAENKAEAELILKGRQSKPVNRDPLPTDGEAALRRSAGRTPRTAPGAPPPSSSLRATRAWSCG